MIGGHRVDLGIVGKSVIDQIECVVAHAVRQCFLPAFNRRFPRALFRLDEIWRALTLDRNAVNIENAVDDLNFVARQSDHALDVIGRSVLRQTKYHHVAPLGQPIAGNFPENSGGDSGNENLL